MKTKILLIFLAACTFACKPRTNKPPVPPAQASVVNGGFTPGSTSFTLYRYYSNDANFVVLFEQAATQFSVQKNPGDLAITFSQLANFSQDKKESLVVFASQRIATLSKLKDAARRGYPAYEDQLSLMHGYGLTLLSAIVAQNSVRNPDLWATQIRENDRHYSLSFFADVLRPALKNPDEHLTDESITNDIKDYVTATSVEAFVTGDTWNVGLEQAAQMADSEIADLDDLITSLTATPPKDPIEFKGWVAFYAYWLQGVTPFNLGDQTNQGMTASLEVARGGRFGFADDLLQALRNDSKIAVAPKPHIVDHVEPPLKRSRSNPEGIGISLKNPFLERAESQAAQIRETTKIGDAPLTLNSLTAVDRLPREAQKTPDAPPPFVDELAQAVAKRQKQLEQKKLATQRVSAPQR